MWVIEHYSDRPTAADEMVADILTFEKLPVFHWWWCYSEWPNVLWHTQRGLWGSDLLWVFLRWADDEAHSRPVRALAVSLIKVREKRSRSAFLCFNVQTLAFRRRDLEHFTELQTSSNQDFKQKTKALLWRMCNYTSLKLNIWQRMPCWFI